MQEAKGTLIPIGGNEDKALGADERDTQEFITDGILSHVVREAGGITAKIVVIPTASSIPIEVGGNYLHAFETLGCKDVSVLDIRSKEDAEKAESIALIKVADCIMFSGGDQSKITDRIGGTEIHKILLNRYQNEEGFVIAGTSAGAMAMSQEMIAGGSSTDAFVKGAVNMYHGLGLIPELIIDTHFIQRGRFGRTSEAIAIHPNIVGIGLAEDTGLIIKRGKEFIVIGSGMIIVFDPSQIKHNNQKRLKEGTPMTLTNVVVHVLANGDRYNIETRAINILPISSPFV
jgi:cyanophycinase